MSEEVQTEAAPVIESAPVVDSTAELQQEPVEQAQPEAKPEKTFTQAELDAILQKRLAKESRKAARIAEIETENRYLKQQMESAQQRQAQQPQGKPTPEQYNDYETYLDALSDWKVDQKLAGIREEAAKSQQQTTQQRQASEFVQRVEAKLSEGAEKYDDYDEVVRDPTAPISQTAYAIAAESEVGADLLYYLATHRDEAQKIFNMPIAAQARAIVKLEDKVTAPPKTTAAPSPITPNGQRATVQKDPDKMPVKEWLEWRNKQLKR